MPYIHSPHLFHFASSVSFQEPQPGRLSMMFNGKRSDCQGSSGSVVVWSIISNSTLSIGNTTRSCAISARPYHVFFISILSSSKVRALHFVLWMQVAAWNIESNCTAYRSPSFHRCHKARPKAAAYNRRASHQSKPCLLIASRSFGHDTTKPLQSPG